jgi:hypothetical protein
MFWFKTRLAKLLESGLYLLEAAIGFGLVSGATVAVVTGKLVLAGILLALALGVLLRFIRRRAR